MLSNLKPFRAVESILKELCRIYRDTLKKENALPLTL